MRACVRRHHPTRLIKLQFFNSFERWNGQPGGQTKHVSRVVSRLALSAMSCSLSFFKHFLKEYMGPACHTMNLIFDLVEKKYILIFVNQSY